MFFKRSDKKTVLVISDEPNILQTLKDRFDNWAPGVKTVTLGPEKFGMNCCDLVKYFGGANLVVIANYSIANYVADEIIQLIYDRQPKTPIIFTPSDIRGRDVIKRFPTMNIKYLEKPFDLTELLLLVEEVIRLPI